MEFRESPAGAPLRQGDILEAVDPEASQWTRHLMVVTADCDFAFGKNQGRVTCVPLLASHEYLLDFQIPRHRNRARDRLIAELQQHLADAGHTRVSDDRLKEWVIEEDPTKIIEAASVPEPSRVAVADLLQGVRDLAQPSTTVEAACNTIASSQLHLAQPRKRETLLNELRSSVSEAFRRPPGDALFLSAIAPGRADGYFAYLRHIEQVWEPEIALAPSRKEAKHRRIARLQDRFTHALVQRFALVFLSIGLPTEYEATRNLYAELASEELK